MENNRFTFALALLAGLTQHVFGDGWSRSGLMPGTYQEPQQVSAEERAEQLEIVRRQQAVFEATAALGQGEEAEIRRDLPKARERYVFALKTMPEARATFVQRGRGIDALKRVNWQIFAVAKENGDTKLATEVLAEIVEYDPYDSKARAEYDRIRGVIPEKIESAILGNPAITPGFTEEVKRVRNLFLLAEKYRRTGQYDSATASLKRILAIDPFNQTATQQLEEIVEEQLLYNTAAFEQTRDERLRDVQRKWLNLPRPEIDGVPDAGDTQEVSFTSNPKAGTTRLLDEIRLPKVRFTNARIDEAGSFFTSRSRALDPDKKGVSFVVKPEALESSKPFSIDLEDVPLRVALDYATLKADVKYKVEEYAVVIVPITAETSVLLQRSWRVLPSFFAVEQKPDEASIRTSRRRDPIIAATQASTNNAEAALKAMGVEFPPGSTAIYNSGNNQLRVKNTEANLDLIDELVGAGQAPTYMVDVNVKLVEINQEDLDDLTFNYGMNLVPNLNGLLPEELTTLLGGGLDVTPSADGSVATALRGSQAFTTKSLDSLLRGTGTPSPNVLRIDSAFDTDFYNIVMTSLSQKRSFDVLASPRLRVQTGMDAKINVTKTFFYPIAFDPPEAAEQQNTDNVIGGANADNGPPTVIPAFPIEFESREIGVRLTIKPQIAADRQTIDLALFPEVTEFEGFINYGDPIFITNLAGEQVLLAQNELPQPVFSVRRVSTKVFVKDSYTVVLGGLIREDIQEVNDKVPIIGDLPLIGRLFRSKAKQTVKRNLLIFVTCNIHLNTGEKLNTTLQRE